MEQMSVQQQYQAFEAENMPRLRGKVRHWISRGAGVWGDFDDMLQEARMRAWVTFLGYDETKAKGKGPWTIVGFELDNWFRNRKKSRLGPTKVERTKVTDPLTGEERLHFNWPLSGDQPFGAEDDRCLFDLARDERHPSFEKLMDDREMLAACGSAIRRAKAQLQPQQRRQMMLEMFPSSNTDFMDYVHRTSGSYQHNRRHIASFLGIDYPTAETNAKLIRRAKAEVGL